MYRVEPYVERCLRSLENQDIPKGEYEIICINDGSPDGSREVVISLQSEFDNIILIDQVNQGVSRARNNGIDKACGKYVLLIDPDDYVDECSFARVLLTADKFEAQVFFLGFTFLNENGTHRNQILNDNLSSLAYKGTQAYHFARGDGKTDPDRMWAILFNREFLNKNNLRFLQDVPYLEDGEFIARILCLAECCTFDGHPFYQRTTRPGSATNSKLFHSSDAISGFLLAASNLKRFQKGQGLSEEQREFLNQPIVKFVLLAVNSSFGLRSNKIFLATVKRLKELNLRRVSLEGCNKTYRVYGKSYNFSPYLGAFFLFLWPRIKKISKC